MQRKKFNVSCKSWKCLEEITNTNYWVMCPPNENIVAKEGIYFSLKDAISTMNEWMNEWNVNVLK